jgi:hypothetical protein
LDKNAVKKIIDELIPRYETRTSGFIKSYHLKNRLGDNAPMMHLELIDKKVFVTKEVPKATKETKEAQTETVKVKETTKAKVKKDGK